MADKKVIIIAVVAICAVAVMGLFLYDQQQKSLQQQALATQIMNNFDITFTGGSSNVDNSIMWLQFRLDCPGYTVNVLKLDCALTADTWNIGEYTNSTGWTVYPSGLVTTITLELHMNQFQQTHLTQSMNVSMAMTAYLATPVGTQAYHETITMDR